MNFNRILSQRLALLLAKLPFVSPNAVTTVGLLTAAMAALCASNGTAFGLLSAAFYIHVSFVLDSADGELARLTDRRSSFGHWYDVCSDVVKDWLVWTGLFFGAVRQGAGDAALPALAAAFIGTLLHFILVVWERKSDCSFHPADVKEEGKTSFFFRTLDSLSHNGASVILIWIAAIAGDAALFLMGAAAFLLSLACVRFFSNFRSLTGGFGPFMAAMARFAGLSLGLWLLWASFQNISWDHVRSLFTAKGLLLLFPALIIFPAASVLHALGFHRLFSGHVRKKVPFSTVYLACLAGDSVNKVTPFADIGGEPLKVWWVSRKDRASGSESLAATYLSKLMFVLAEGLFILLGVFAIAALKPSAFLTWMGIAGALVTFGFFGLLFYFPRNVLRWMRQPVAGETEGLIGEALKNRKADLLVSFLWNFAGCAILFLEIHWTLRILGLSVSTADSLLIQALLRAIQSATFFIPAQIGSQESGLMALVAHFHFPSVHGLAVSLLRRLRQVFWGALAAMLLLTVARLTVPVARKA